MFKMTLRIFAPAAAGMIIGALLILCFHGTQALSEMSFPLLFGLTTGLGTAVVGALFTKKNLK